MHTTLPGHELTTEPFRWDQRLFSIILRMPGTRSSLPNKMGMHNGDPAIAAMCEVTGGSVKHLRVQSIIFCPCQFYCYFVEVNLKSQLSFYLQGDVTKSHLPSPWGKLWNHLHRKCSVGWC